MDILTAADTLYESLAQAPAAVWFRLRVIQSYERGYGCGAPIEEGMLRDLADAGYRDGEWLDLYHYYHGYPEHPHYRGGNP
ncbi:MAG: hypothetical protein JW781_05400 [Deltaproteobacteria bacterium]|nr:hypothetical protein [Candidatus Anaeroferrophillacea bacterium]